MKTTIRQKETLKALIMAEAARTIELLEKLTPADMNNKLYSNSQELKAELKSKMHELRRDTVRLEKVLQEWE